VCVLTHVKSSPAPPALPAQPASPAQDPSAAFDVLITNGRVVDGTGAPWFRADVGIIGDRIAAIGQLSGREARPDRAQIS
jgi:adenine deaminase